MRTIVRHIGCAACAAALLGSSCPDPVGPLPPNLGPPCILSLDMTAVKTGSGAAYRYREAVRITWQAPPQDSNKVMNYFVLRKAALSQDTTLSVVAHSIPGEVTTYEDRLDQITPPAIGKEKYLEYRIASVDTLSEPGDTSAPDTFVYAHPPRLYAPVDTMAANFFTWGITKMPLGFFTYMMLWNEDGLVWQSPRPQSPTYGGENPEIPVSVSLPDTLWPLPSGMYYFGVKVEAVTGGLTTQSFIVSEPVYVP